MTESMQKVKGQFATKNTQGIVKRESLEICRYRVTRCLRINNLTY